jgi:hypothetical protein
VDEVKTDDIRDDRWLSMARDAFGQSTDWFDTSVRSSVEKSMAHFANRHAPGSRYHSELYKYRAKGFRPKTRATIRRNEAAAAVAFFSTQDIVKIAAEDEANKEQQMSAKLLTELLNYRMDDSVPWFRTLIGAYQDAMNTGVCISHQYWDFDEDVTNEPAEDELNRPILDETGAQIQNEVRTTLIDKPVVELIAIENFRISPAADWLDPIGTTPYIVQMIPMYVGDIKKRMDAGTWAPLEADQIRESGEYDSIRSAREGKRQDGQDIQHSNSEFDIAWVHRNIIRDDGADIIFYTLGTRHRLTEPKPLEEAYIHLRRGERPYVMGSCILETHKHIPCGLTELISPLQEDANDIANQRRDNVALALNKRYFAKRTANVDYKSLTRNVPGSITLVDDINTDIRWDNPPEVTGSSYQEQDRISLDFDEIAGTFSPGSVQSNRKLNETVGGMNLLSGDANAITEYQLRLFSSSWVEPVLKQVVRLEQAYETDETILTIAGGKAKIQQFGVNRITDQMLQGMVTVRISVGFGAINPQQRIEKLVMGLNSVGQFIPALLQGLDGREIVTEIFGALGYKGAERFFPQIAQDQEDPAIAQLKQQVQQLTQALEQKQVEQQGRLQVEQERSRSRREIEDLRNQARFEIEKLKAQLSTIDATLHREKNQIDIERLKNERAAVVSEIADKTRAAATLASPANKSMSGVLARDDYNIVPGAVG